MHNLRIPRCEVEANTGKSNDFFFCVTTFSSQGVNSGKPSTGVPGVPAMNPQLAGVSVGSA